MSSISDFIKKWFPAPPAPAPKPAPVVVTPPPIPSTNVLVEPQPLPPWMKIAVGMINTKETPGTADNPEILHWAAEMGGDVARDYNHDSIPWCGLFVGITQKLGGMPGIKTPLWAASWDTYGTNLKEPAFGCIMRFGRDGGGHVAYYVSEDSNYYHILGGNQSDMVNVTRMAKTRLVACRWPPGADEFYRLGRIIKPFDGRV